LLNWGWHKKKVFLYWGEIPATPKFSKMLMIEMSVFPVPLLDLLFLGRTALQTLLACFGHSAL
jgi:hypothetical protein